VDYHGIHYYIKPKVTNARSWDDVTAEEKRTFDRLGIPEAEQKFLAGVGAQYESEVIYQSTSKNRGLSFWAPMMG